MPTNVLPNASKRMFNRDKVIMVGYIYLVRHGQPEIQSGQTYCIGRLSDPSLSENGRKQAVLLSKFFDGFAFHMVYCSSLRRSIETAEILAAGKCPLFSSPNLDEIDVGEWEGLSFDQIRSKYPQIYDARREDWSICPPGGESLEAAADRMENALKELIGREEHDVLAVTHDGAIRALLWRLMKSDTKRDVMIRQPYGSITVIKYDGNTFTATATGKLPDDTPKDDEIETLWKICGTPENVREHCQSVCEESLKIWEELKPSGILLSQERLRTASLLHDLCRADGHQHPHKAANILRERGYLNVARIVEVHHDGALKEGIDEAQVLFLADKLIDGTRTVTLRERFEASLDKCTTFDAKSNYEARYKEALLIQEKINKELR